MTARARVHTAAVVVVVVGGLGLAACGGGKKVPSAGGASVDTRAVVARAGVGADGKPPLDPGPEDLIEPRAKSQSERLIAEAAQRSTFCGVAVVLGGLPEPDWHDLEELTEWATGYYAWTGSLDPRSEVTDPANDEQIQVPDELVELVGTLRRATFAYLVRLEYAAELHRQGLANDTDLRRRLDHAFVTLVNSEFTWADKAVVETSMRYCR